jgi:hypothetical protein
MLTHDVKIKKKYIYMSTPNLAQLNVFFTMLGKKK